jgi:hypothetical protein
LGGTGKGTLLDELESQTPRDTCVIRLDLGQKSLRKDYLTLLENFSLQIESYCDPERTVEFKRSIAKGRFEIGKKVNRGDTSIGEINQQIEGGDDLDVSDTEFSVDVGEDHIEETRSQMRELSKEKFYAQMKTIAARRLVIMLDTCEWLGVTKGAEAGQWAVDEVIPGLHASMQKKGQQCFMLMASRVPLHLNCINQKDQEEWKLDMLTRSEVYQCLEQMEIHDPVIRDFIYNMTYGHPHSLSIIHDIWEDRWEFSDSPLSTSDLPKLQGLFYEQALQAIVDNDVLQRLLSPPATLSFQGMASRARSTQAVRAIHSLSTC